MPVSPVNPATPKPHVRRWLAALACLACLSSPGCGNEVDKDQVVGAWRVDVEETARRFPNSVVVTGALTNPAAPEDPEQAKAALRNMRLTFTLDDVTLTSQLGSRTVSTSGPWEVAGQYVNAQPNAKNKDIVRFSLEDGFLVSHGASPSERIVLRRFSEDGDDDTSVASSATPPAPVATPPTPARAKSLAPGELVRKTSDEIRNVIDWLAFSADGARLLTGSQIGKELLAYQTSDWTPIEGSRIRYPDGNLHGVAVTPNGGQGLCWGAGKAVYQWDLSSGQTLQHYVHESDVDCATASSDGRLVATAGEFLTKYIHVWRADTGEHVASSECPWHGALALAFSSDDKALYAACPYGILVVNAETGKELHRWEFAANDSAAHAAIAASGDRALFVVNRFELMLWDLQRGVQQFRLFDADRSPLYAVAISPDGRYALTGGLTDKASLWDLQKRQRVRQIGPLPSRPYVLAFHPQGTSFVAAGEGFLSVWELPEAATSTSASSPRPEGNPFDKPSDDAVSGEGPPSIQAPKPGEGAIAAREFGMGTPRPYTMAFSPDSSRALVGDRYFDLNTGRQLNVFQYADKASRKDLHATAIDFSADGAKVLTGDPIEGATLWDAARGTPVVRFSEARRAPFANLSDDGKRALISDGRSELVLYDAESATLVRKFKPPSAMQAIALAPNHRAVAIGFQEVLIWDTESGVELETLKSETYGFGAWRATLAADAEVALFRSGDRRLAYCDLAKREVKPIPWDAKASIFSAMAISGNGRVAAFSVPPRTYFWDLFRNREISQHETAQDCLALSRDGRYALSHNKTRRSLTLWRLPDMP